MDSILDRLYAHFYAPPQLEETRRLEELRRQLAAGLNRPQRLMLLELLDQSGQMADRLSRDGFCRGFRLAMQLCRELEALAGEEE